MRYFFDWSGPTWRDEDYDPQAKFWHCSCAACQRRAWHARIMLAIILWDLDRLFMFVR